MKLQYKEFMTGTEAEIDLFESRDSVGLKLADAYCRQFKKSQTDNVIQSFTRDVGIYWAVRDMLEKIGGNDFNVVVQKFKSLWPQMHSDWQSALTTGLAISAGKREGNYTDKPFIYSDPLAVEIRERGLNDLYPVLEKILTSEQVEAYKMRYARNVKTT